MDFTKEDNEAVEWCEKSYPELCTEYKKIMMEQYVMFCKKHRNYGTGNINVGTNLETDNDVKLSLTFQDMSIYGIIAQLVQQKKFK